MSQFGSRSAAGVAVLLFILALGGCAGSSHMMRDVPPEQANYAVQSGKALVVFMRPSGLGFGVQSPVYEVGGGDPKLVAIVSAKAKYAYYVAPGSHRFMVTGETADFLDAELAAGKVYYSLVEPKMGFWKARFAFLPLKDADVKNEDFADWYESSRWVENLDAASVWVKEHMPDIRAKMNKYLPEWQQQANKAALAAEDGQPSLPAPK